MAAIFREITSQAAGKGVPGAGGIMNVFQRIGWATEKLALAEEQTSVLAFLDGDVFRPESLIFLPARMRLVSSVS